MPGTGDSGEGNGLNPIDTGELDGNYDTGDGCFGCDSGENELVGRFQQINDTNHSSLYDDLDFEIGNEKLKHVLILMGYHF